MCQLVGRKQGGVAGRGSVTQRQMAASGQASHQWWKSLTLAISVSDGQIIN